MTLYLSKYLNKNHIDTIKADFGFTNPQIIEKFIMDFEMQYQIAQELDCITRGGLCVPFHLNDQSVRRLSVDIDLVTNASVDETERTIERFRGKLPEITLTKIIPINPRPLPLVSYRAHYKSCYGREDFIKVDILCDTKILPKDIKTVKAGYSVFAFDTPGDVVVLDHGSLIGDKLSTLSLNTKLGLDVKTHGNEIPKQLYDIGALLKIIGRDKVVQSFDTFSSYTNLKIQRIIPSLSINDIITDVGNSLEGLVETSRQLSLVKDHSKRFDSFKGNYLGRLSYRTQNHITDIFLIRLFNKAILSVRNGNAAPNAAADILFGQIQELNRIQSMEEGEERARVKNDLINSLSQSSGIPQKILNGASPEHIFLMKQLLD